MKISWIIKLKFEPFQPLLKLNASCELFKIIFHIFSLTFAGLLWREMAAQVQVAEQTLFCNQASSNTGTDQSCKNLFQHDSWKHKLHLARFWFKMWSLNKFALSKFSLRLSLLGTNSSCVNLQWSIHTIEIYDSY